MRRDDVDLLLSLARRCAKDLEWLSEGPNRCLVYVVDSTEFAAFIEPDLRHHFRGFGLPFEETSGQDHDPDAWRRLAHRSDSSLGEIFFDELNPVLLAPQHAMEIYERLGQIRDSRKRSQAVFKNYNKGLLEEEISLIIMGFERWEQAYKDGSPEEPDLFRALVERAAPFHVAMLDLPDTPMGRIRMLAERGRYRLAQEYPWEELGVELPPGTAEALRSLEVDDDSFLRWYHSVVDCRRGDPASSARADRYDAEVLAFVEAANHELEVRGCENRVRICFVTRTPTFLEAQPFRNNKWLHVRHPRMLAPARLADRSETANRAPEKLFREFLLALEALEHRIGEGGLGAPERSGAGTSTPQASTLNELEARLRRAWETFEDARLSQSNWHRIRREGIENARVELSRFVALLREVSLAELDDRLGELVEERTRELIRAAASFGRARLHYGDRARARVQLCGDMRCLIISKGTDTVMVRVSEAMDASGAQGSVPDLAERLYDPVESSAQSLLRWAVLDVSRGEWQLANSELEAARKAAIERRDVPPAKRRALADECDLLRAHVVRHFGTEPAIRFARRLLDEVERSIDKGTDSGRRDFRIALERASLDLEALLDETDAEALALSCFRICAYMREFERAEAKGDPLLSVLGAERALSALVVLGEKSPSSEDIPAEFAEEAWFWLSKIRAGLERLKDRGWSFEELPIRALILQHLAATRLVPSSAASPGGPPLMKPETLAYSAAFALDMLERVGPATDRVGAWLRDRLASWLRVERARHLIDVDLAPIWAEYGTELVLERLSDAPEIKKKAEAAYVNLRSMLNHAIEAGKLSSLLMRFTALVEVLSSQRVQECVGKHNADFLHFIFRMEANYVRLLMCWLERERDKEKAARSLVDLVRSYEEIARRFPSAAVPHYRISTICRILLEMGYGRLRVDAAGPEVDLQVLKRNASRLALERVDRDPYLREEHWIRWSIRRRVSAHIMEEARQRLKALRERAGHDAVDSRELRGLRQELERACRYMIGGLENRERNAPPWFDRERRRLLNNRLYLVTLYLEAEGSLKKLQDRVELPITKLKEEAEELESFLKGPDRRAEPDWVRLSIWHTLFRAWLLAFKNPQRARSCRRQLLETLDDAIEETSAGQLREILSDIAILAQREHERAGRRYLRGSTPPVTPR